MEILFLIIGIGSAAERANAASGTRMSVEISERTQWGSRRRGRTFSVRDRAEVSVGE